MKSKNLPGYTKSRIVMLCFLLFAWGTGFAQNGYIYIHKKALDEGSSPNFTFNISGGPTTVPSVALNDQADALTFIVGLGADSGGGLWALAGNAADGSGNFAVYFRGAGSSAWVSGAGTAIDIDGGAAGSYIMANAAGNVLFYDGSALSDVTGNLPAAARMVSDNWAGRQYALLSNNQVWTRLTSSATWTQVPGIAAIDIDAVQGTNRFVYVNTGDQDVYRANFNGSGVTFLDYIPIYAVNVAITQSGDIYASNGVDLYHHIGNNWVFEKGGQELQDLTGGPATQLWGNLIRSGAATSNRIIPRTETGDYIGDESVRLSPNDNATMVAVAPGTYTIAESALPGWDLNKITLYESQSPSSFDVSTNTATIVVDAGEVVHVVYENQLAQTTTIVNDCNAAATFKETFGTGTGYGGPLTGLTSYHHATADYGYGYYSVVNNTSLMGSYAGNYTDHTGDANGRMLGVDATVERGVFYRRRFDGLIPGASYSFSAWIMNVNDRQDKPNVTFSVYDPTSGTLLSSTNSGDVIGAGVWKQATLVFTATQSVVDLELNNNTLGTIGNDLAIDDITFGVAIPQPVVAHTDATCSTAGSITVQSPLSPGYEYSIDGIAYQASPAFPNVPAGTYSVTARYTSGICASPPTLVTIAGAQCPPVASDDNSLSNPLGSTTTVNILTNDQVSDGSGATPANTTVTLTTTGLPAGSTVVSNVLTVPGEGTYTFNPATGELTFVPQSGFTANPTPITYILTETATGLTDPALVTITYSAMPVTLVAFNAVLIENRVHLTWSTTEESNSDYFRIERSADGKNWQAIGTERASGESQVLVQYEHWDNEPFSSKSYYRLKMVDLDETFAYSAIRYIGGPAGDARPVVYPVPAVNEVYVSNLDIAMVKEWSISNVAGTIVKNGNRLSAPVIQFNGLPSGLYILRISSTNGALYTHKLIVTGK